MPKRTLPSDNNRAKKWKTMTLREKVDIIKHNEKGEKVSVIACALELSRTTVATIIQDKERIMNSIKGATPMNSTVLTKKRSGVLMEMERLLMLWIKDNNQRRISISESVTCEKARTLYEDLKKEGDADGENGNETFLASKGWITHFRARGNLTNRKMYGEAASADDE